jgi:type I restriction enzyme, R subunit
MLLEAGTGTPEDIERAKREGLTLGLSLRSLVGLDREAAKGSLNELLQGKKPSANQIEFINLIVDYLTQRGWMEPSSLYESPFTDISSRGVEGVFAPRDVEHLLVAQTFDLRSPNIRLELTALCATVQAFCRAYG